MSARAAQPPLGRSIPGVGLGPMGTYERPDAREAASREATNCEAASREPRGRESTVSRRPVPWCAYMIARRPRVTVAHEEGSCGRQWPRRLPVCRVAVGPSLLRRFGTNRSPSHRPPPGSRTRSRSERPRAQPLGNSPNSLRCTVFVRGEPLQVPPCRCVASQLAPRSFVASGPTAPRHTAPLRGHATARVLSSRALSRWGTLRTPFAASSRGSPGPCCGRPSCG